MEKFNKKCYVCDRGQVCKVKKSTCESCFFATSHQRATLAVDKIIKKNSFDWIGEFLLYEIYCTQVLETVPNPIILVKLKALLCKKFRNGYEFNYKARK